MPLPPTFVPGFHEKDVVKRLDYRRLGKTDLIVPNISFGGSHLAIGVDFDEVTGQPVEGHEKAVETVRTALKSGLNYIDVAPLYGAGRAEVVLGKALEGIPREAYYLATKVGRTSDCVFDFSPQTCLQSIDKSSKKLGVNYFDVIIVHDVEFADNIGLLVDDVLPTLAKLKDEGRVRYLGISGYPVERLKQVIERSTVSLDIVLSYCRCTLFDATLFKYLEYFENKGLGIINAGVLGMGLLTNNPTPAWHPAGDDMKRACREAADYLKLKGLEISRLATGYAFEVPGVGTTLVGMKDSQVLEANLDVAINGLTAEERKELQYVRRSFFDPIGAATHWEGKEVDRFRANKRAFEEFLRKDLSQ